MTFDYTYWGIMQNNLEQGEEVVQALAKLYQFSMNDLCNIEEIAKENAQELFPYSGGFDNLSNIINTEKIKAAITLICKRENLNENDFNYEVNGNIIEVMYKNNYII